MPTNTDQMPDTEQLFELATLGSSHVSEKDAPLPPWPVIGMGQLDAADADRVDVVAPTLALQARIVAAITRHPRASMVLVQLLRAIERLDPAIALPIESLAFATLQGGTDFSNWLASRALLPRKLAPHSGDPVLIHRRGDHVDIVLNRPVTRNAMDRAMRDALSQAFELVAIDRNIATAAVRGQGDCFSVGGDLTEFGTTRDPAEAHHIRCRTLPARHLIERADCYTFYLQGGCIGAGIELAAFGGRIVASPDTWFQLPELAMGLIPGAGGCVSIMHRVGRQRMALMVLTGKRISAKTALDWGLIDAIAPTM